MIRPKEFTGGIICIIGLLIMGYYGNWQTAVGALTIVIGVVKCLR